MTKTERSARAKKAAAASAKVRTKQVRERRKAEKLAPKREESVMRASMEWYRLTTEVQAILLDDYSREDGTEQLPIGTLFRVYADERTVPEHPGVVFNAIIANGRQYRVEAAAIDEKHEKFDAPKGE